MTVHRFLRPSDHVRIYCTLDNPDHRAALPAAWKWLCKTVKATSDAPVDAWYPSILFPPMNTTEEGCINSPSSCSSVPYLASILCQLWHLTHLCAAAVVVVDPDCCVFRFCGQVLAVLGPHAVSVKYTHPPIDHSEDPLVRPLLTDAAVHSTHLLH